MTTDCLSSKSEQGRHESAQFSTQGRGTITLTEYFNRTMGEETKFVSSTYYGSGYMCLAKAMLVASVRPNRGGRQPGEVSCVLQLAVVCPAVYKYAMLVFITCFNFTNKRSHSHKWAFLQAHGQKGMRNFWKLRIILTSSLLLGPNILGTLFLNPKIRSGRTETDRVTVFLQKSLAKSLGHCLANKSKNDGWQTPYSPVDLFCPPPSHSLEPCLF